MRSTLLLTSLLAMLPVSLICLALNPRIHVNQFLYSLYPRPPPLPSLLEGLTPRFLFPTKCRVAPFIIIRDATSKHIHLPLCQEAVLADVCVLQTG